MSDYQSTTIKAAINKINSRGMFLPSIQRIFVWTDEQITKLFDSIMRGYPIGTFLFWEIDKETLNRKGYTLYEFLHDYHERDSYLNSLAPAPYVPNDGESSADSFVTAVLDGQQRLTSLYLSLQGTITRKKPRARIKTDEAYIKKELYFNLHSQKPAEEPEDDSIIYEFKFLSEDEFKSVNTPEMCPDEDKCLWYKAKDILQYGRDITMNRIAKDNKPSFNNDDIAVNNLERLHTRLVKDEIINYFNAKSSREDDKFTTLDEVTDIFVRINSGGTKLNKTDLLFSRIVSIWNNAREEFQTLTKLLNAHDKYKFDNDYIIKVCLMAINCQSKIKAESLTKENIERIEREWGNIRESIIDIRNVLSDNGIVHESIASYNSLLPLVLFRYRFGRSSITNANVQSMKKYVVVSQVENLFGKSSNSILDRLQKQIYDLNDPDYPELKNLKFYNDKTVLLDRNTIKVWFDLEKGPSTFIILTLLYSNCRFNEKSFDQDHMHPYSAFDRKSNIEIVKNVFDYDENGNAVTVDLSKKTDLLKHQRNKLANLQLLGYVGNIQKHDSPLKQWIETHRDQVMYLPSDCSLELADFEEFLEKRQRLMEDELCRIFGVE